MLVMRRFSAFLVLAAVHEGLLGVRGHVAAWHKGMYCLNGTSGMEDLNTNEAVTPLFKLSRNDWWFHHENNCDQFPPAPGDFLELPANGDFTVEHAINRAYTSLSYDGKFASTFTNGQEDPGIGISPGGLAPACITSPNIHTENETMASGTAFAISYQSDISQVTPENLVVFSVLYHSPWQRIATYSVPNLPACPEEGCICAWGWVPNGCGEPNMYMLPYRCKVTGTPGTAAVGSAVPPAWCEDNTKNCTSGPKQMIYWNQAEGNNIQVGGLDRSGLPRSPAYNGKLGFADGAQIDIFVTEPTITSTPSSVGATSTASYGSGFVTPTSVSPPGIPPGPRSTNMTSGTRLSFTTSLYHLLAMSIVAFMVVFLV